MKRFLVFIFIVFRAVHILCSERVEDNGKLALSSGFSVMYGTINEYVYDEGRRASCLAWDIKPLMLAGMSLEYEFQSLRFNGSLCFALNENTGSIRDYDWDTSSGVMTNFSRHDAKQRGSFFTDITGNHLFVISENVIIFTGFGLKYSTINLTAEDGYLEYPPGSTPVRVYGKGIIYEQKHLIPYISAGIDYSSGDFVYSFVVDYSCFAMCNARDSHLKRDIDFYDEIRNANFYCIGGEVLYSLSDIVSISVSAEWFYIPETSGDSYYIDLATGTRSEVFKNSGGIKVDYKEVKISISSMLDRS